MIWAKYVAVRNFPIASNGLSTVLVPIHVKAVRVVVRDQKFIFFQLENFVDFFFVFRRTTRIMIEASMAITPPNLEGIDRRIT